MIHVGIDNGTCSGAICAISGSLIIDKALLPVSIRKDKKELDVNKLWDWICHTVQPQNFGRMLITVEEPGGAKSYKAAVSMASCFQSIRAMCELKDIKWKAVTPQSWQKPMLKASKGNTKPAALKLAKSIWPDEIWTATKRSKIPHAGLVDCCLIAEFSRRNTKEL